MNNPVKNVDIIMIFFVDNKDGKIGQLSCIQNSKNCDINATILVDR